MRQAEQKPTEKKVEVERRRCIRYEIRGAAWFQWETEEGESREGMGVTHDIGRTGTYIKTPAKPPVGVRLKVVVTISSGVKDEMLVRLCGAGDVRHVQSDPQAESGFGAWVGFHTEGAGIAGCS